MAEVLMDEDALIAAVDLVGRAGAKAFEVGYLDDDVPADQARWWAHADYRGNRIIVENESGPVEAAEKLARRILTGGRCRCGKLVALASDGAVAYENVTMADGSTWTAEEARTAGQCRWTREGRKWVSACGAGKQNRRERRRKRK